MKRKIGILIVSVIFILAGCHSKNEDLISGEDMLELSSTTQQKGVTNIERKLVKEGWIEFESKDLLETKKFLSNALARYHGYVSSDREHKSQGKISRVITIRVPAKDFDHLLNEVSGIAGNLDNKEITLKDVTEEFIDIEARLRTKKELEKRYLNLLDQATNVTEMLEIERELNKLRSEIESVEGRLKYLTNKVSLSTLTVTFYQYVSDDSEFGRRFKHAFSNGIDNFIWFFVFLANIWPFAVIAIVLIAGLKIRKRISKD
ncbi:DUF4349 domain-containing protein [Fulvivirgaceae bacterium BMA10]|uniref:DUF4349 domain-containing protein n=1 Tax=Splendidivirga corallicola TaxID=3051826 RepID=A0ABT8KKI3_9BACT|nr:DUF4349 domain-containing protein [Fulvivirgaceae bacterium BMA10]